MSEQKTQPTELSVDTYLNGLDDKQKAEDSRTLIQIMNQITGEPAVMWGASMIGFGKFHYVYESGHEGDTFLVGFAPRSKALTLYLATDLSALADELAELGPHKLGKGCLYVKRLSDVNADVLRKLIIQSVDQARRRATT